jgi:hypothetical protein
MRNKKGPRAKAYGPWNPATVLLGSFDRIAEDFILIANDKATVGNHWMRPARFATGFCKLE